MARTAPFTKLRYHWKRRIQSSAYLAPRTKHFAMFVCDQFVSKANGCFWARNTTLASAFGVHERSIQRYLRELEGCGWITRVRRRGVRGTFQISVPRDAERDTEHDIDIRQRATDLYWKGDNIVAHNKNIGKNIETKLGATGGGAYHWFDESDASALREWEAFEAAKTAFNFEALAQLLRKDGSIALPARFPKSEEADRYVRFFGEVVLSKGQSIGTAPSPTR